LVDLVEFQAIAASLDGTAAGIRDRGELEGAVGRPFQTGGGGHVFFLSPFEKAAALADSIVRRQPFVDGNKRAAAFAAARMLSLFGLLLVTEPDRLRDAMLSLDRGEITQDDFAGWLEERSISQEKEGQ
jgi:death on curing protein